MGIIRFLLAIAVVVYHSVPLWGNTMVSGQLAVQAFYIISGFYMTLILTEKYNNYKLFISNRLLRLMPMYWFVLLLGLSYSLFILAVNKEHSAYLEPFIEHFGDFNWASKAYIIFTNLFIVGQDTVMFSGINLETGAIYYTGNVSVGNPPLYNFLFIPQAWTISLEIMFYLIAPFIVKRKTSIIVGLIIISLACRIILARNGLDYDPWSYRFFPNEIAFFLLGILSFRLYKHIQYMKTFAISIGFLLAIVLFTFTYQFIDISFKYYLT